MVRPAAADSAPQIFRMPPQEHCTPPPACPCPGEAEEAAPEAEGSQATDASAAFARRRTEANEQLLRLQMLQDSGPADEVTANLEDGTLQVQGTSAEDELYLTEEEGEYVLNALREDGEMEEIFRGSAEEIEEIQIATYGGDDVISNQIVGEGPRVSLNAGAGFDIIENRTDDAVITGNASAPPDGSLQWRDVNYLTNTGNNVLLEELGTDQWDVVQRGDAGAFRLDGGGAVTLQGQDNNVVGPEGLSVTDSGNNNTFGAEDSEALAPGAPNSTSIEQIWQAIFSWLFGGQF